MVGRARSAGPGELSVCFTNGQIVDAGVAMRHIALAIMKTKDIAFESSMQSLKSFIQMWSMMTQI